MPGILLPASLAVHVLNKQSFVIINILLIDTNFNKQYFPSFLKVSSKIMQWQTFQPGITAGKSRRACAQ